MIADLIRILSVPLALWAAYQLQRRVDDWAGR